MQSEQGPVSIQSTRSCLYTVLYIVSILRPRPADNRDDHATLSMPGPIDNANPSLMRITIQLDEYLIELNPDLQLQPLGHTLRAW